MKNNCWKKTDNESRYKVWESKKNKGFSIVTKTEFGQWHTFKHMSSGTSELYVGKSKKQALKYANKYMREHNSC